MSSGVQKDSFKLAKENLAKRTEKFSKIYDFEIFTKWLKHVQCGIFA